MPRTARIVIPGYLYHITQRGNFKQAVFQDDQDRATYLKYIQGSAKKSETSLYAYCLMDNHVHFLVKPIREKSLARTFSAAHMKYSQYFNKKNNRRGHLWQSRFYSSMVVGSHISEAFRYVENNPVRAGMVEKAWHYGWSSARAHLGKTYKIIHLADAREFLEIKEWMAYLEEPQSDLMITEIREKTRKGLILATADFIERLEQSLGMKIVRNPRGRPKKLGTDTIL